MALSDAGEVDDRIRAVTIGNDQADVACHTMNGKLGDFPHDQCVLKSPGPPSNVATVAVGPRSCHPHACRTIHTLPPAILLMIFLSLQHGPNVFAMGGGCGMDWLLVTQVCSSWRRIAIGAAWLWANIPTVFGPEWMRLALKRSQSSSINVHFFYPGLLLDMEEEVLYNFFRLKYLSLSDDWHVLQRFLHKMVKDAPELEDLRIEGVETNGRQILHAPDALHIERKGRAVSFPPDLLGGHATRLRHLELCRTSLPGAFPIFRGLTSLVLRDIYPALEFPATGDPSSTTPSPRLSSSDLLTFLANTPALMVLRLTNAFKQDLLDTGQRMCRGLKVRLPCLQTLSIEASSMEYIVFWCSVDIPTACRMQVSASDDGNFKTMRTIINTFSRHCFRWPQPFTHVEVLFKDDCHPDQLCIGFHPEFFHPPNVWYSCHSRVGLVCPPQLRSQLYSQIVCGFLCNVPGIRSISFDELRQRSLTTADFANFFGSPNLDGVHTFRLTFFDVDAFSAFLRTKRITTLEGKQVTGPMMPGLKVLVMSDNDPCEWGHVCQGSEPRIWNPGVDDALAELVRFRKAHNVPLERLVIKGYWEMEREFMDALTAKVGDEVQIEETLLPHTQEEFEDDEDEDDAEDEDVEDVLVSGLP